MTVQRLFKLVEALQNGDYAVPDDFESKIALLQYGFHYIGHKVTVKAWLEEYSDTADVVRQATSFQNSDGSITQYILREPELPNSESDEIDIDNELVFALARIIAHSISSIERGVVHRKAFEELINIYNRKIYSHEYQICQENYDTCSIAGSGS